jgi:hypothetical protein
LVDGVVVAVVRLIDVLVMDILPELVIFIVGG